MKTEGENPLIPFDNMNDLPSFKDMFYTVRRNNCYAMQKSVAEHLEKRNKAIEMMGWDEGQKYLDETQPPQKGLHVNNIIQTSHGSDGPYNEHRFDPKLFDIVYTDQDHPDKPIGGYYESVILPNKDSRRHSDAKMKYFSNDIDNSNRSHGVITELYPDAPVLYIRTKQDWNDLFNKFKPSYSEEGRYIPWQNLLRDYDAVQFETFPNKDHFEYLGKLNDVSHVPFGARDLKEYEKIYERAYDEKGIANNRNWNTDFKDDILYPYEGRSNYRLILNPYSVMSSRPYGTYGGSKDTDIRHESPRTENYAPYDRKKALEKLGQRYKDAGIEYDWEPFTPSSDNSSSES